MKPRVRWLVRRDMPALVRIERDSSDLPWQEADVLNALRRSRSVGLVAEYEADILGFMIYRNRPPKARLDAPNCDVPQGSCRPRRIEILRLAVSPAARRRGVGRRLVDYVKKKLIDHQRDELTAVVGEENLPAQLFFRGEGFRATSVLHDHRGRGTGDAYLMRYRIVAAPGLFLGVNRISNYFDIEA